MARALEAAWVLASTMVSAAASAAASVAVSAAASVAVSASASVAAGAAWESALGEGGPDWPEWRSPPRHSSRSE
jgi:hypothetical protein